MLVKNPSNPQNDSKTISKVMKILEESLEAEDYKKILLWPWLLFLALGGISLFTLPVSNTIRIVLISILGIIIIAYTFSIMFCMEMFRRKAKKNLTEFEKLAASAEKRSTYYAKALSDIQRSDPTLFTIDSWDETLKINGKGDVEGVKDLVLISGDKPIPVVSSLLSSYESVDPTLSAPMGVKYQACWLDEDGQDGVPIHSTYNFSRNHANGFDMVAFLHYIDTTIEPQTSLRIRVHWTWPGHSYSLMHGKTEKFDLRFNRQCRHLSHTVVLQSDCSINDSVRMQPLNSTTPPVQRTKNPDGSVSFTLETDEVTPGSTYGFVLADGGRRSNKR